MWIFTDTGFISAVRKPWNKDKITVRARDKKSLAEFVERYGAKIDTTTHTDYPHRVVLEDADYKDWLVSKVDDLDYDNFKNQVAKTRGKDFAHLLGGVWGEMLGATEIEREEEDPQYRAFRKGVRYGYEYQTLEDFSYDEDDDYYR